MHAGASAVHTEIDKDNIHVTPDPASCGRTAGKFRLAGGMDACIHIPYLKHRPGLRGKAPAGFGRHFPDNSRSRRMASSTASVT